MKEDKEFRELFSGFEPKLPSDFDFMSRLEHGLAAVEAIRSNVADERRRNRRALVIAALSGFASGSIFTALIPYLTDAIARWQHGLPASVFADIIAGNTAALAWTAAAAAAIIVSLNAYELSLAVLKRK